MHKVDVETAYMNLTRSILLVMIHPQVWMELQMFMVQKVDVCFSPSPSPTLLKRVKLHVILIAPGLQKWLKSYR